MSDPALHGNMIAALDVRVDGVERRTSGMEGTLATLSADLTRLGAAQNAMQAEAVKSNSTILAQLSGLSLSVESMKTAAEREAGRREGAAEAERKGDATRREEAQIRAAAERDNRLNVATWLRWVIGIAIALAIPFGLWVARAYFLELAHTTRTINLEVGTKP